MVIDKSNWVPTTLADVTVKKEENDKVNASRKFDKFLKVEHLDAENLNITRWGIVGKDELPPTFYKVFRKGQILYPTRNPHLKRAALASFDGICGEKTLTLEPIKEIIIERFYPFIFLAHTFYNHSTKSIIGSTNPHVRWRDIAKFKFLLPPQDQQAKLADLLWAADEVVEKKVKLLSKIEHLYYLLLDISYASKSELIPIFKISDINKESLNANTPKNYRFKYMDIASIVRPKVFDNLQELEFKNAPSRARRIVQDGNIVLSLVRPYFKSFVIVKTAKDIIASTGTAVIAVNNNFDRDYVFHSFFSKRFSEFCELRMNGTSYPAITANDVKEFEIPLLPLKIQKEISSKLVLLDTLFFELESSIIQTRNLLNTLVNQIFS